MVSELINANPIVYEKKERRDRSAPSVADEYTAEPIDQLEIFDILVLMMAEIVFCYARLEINLSTIREFR